MLRFDPALRVDIPPDLLDALRARSSAYPPITDHHPGVVLTQGMGDAMVLTWAGDLVVHPYMDDLWGEVPIRAAKHFGEVTTGLRIAADRPGGEPFRRLLPPRPPDARRCPACRGEGRRPLLGHRFICATCHGLGWPHPRLPAG